MISIIIPIYNAEKTLRRCIDSIATQTYKDWDCLLVDDGSTDHSAEICKEFEIRDKRFRLIQKKNGGASSARNFGLNNVMTKYVTFCDSDDYVESNWLSTFIKGMKLADVVVSSMTYLRDGFEGEASVFNYDFHEVPLGWLLMTLDGNAGSPCNKCYRVDIIRAHGIRFNENYKLYEDEEFVTHYMMYAKSIIFSKERTYNYIVMDNWRGKYNDVDTFDCVLDIYNHMTRFLPFEKPFISAYTSIIGRLIDGLAYYYNKKDFNTALTDLKKLYSILQSMPQIDVPLNRKSRFLFKEHPVLTHNLYKLLGLIGKL